MGYAKTSLLSAALLAVSCDASLGASFREAERDRERSNAGGYSDDELRDSPSVSTRFRRLTHTQWQNTVSDLVEAEPDSELAALIEEAAGRFRDDARQGGYLFEGEGDSMEVDPTLWSAYQRAALDLARQLTRDDSWTDRWASSDGADVDRARSFIERFGSRVHRDALSESDVASYLELYELGTQSYDDSTGFSAGIRLVLEAMFQSPYFVYRIEGDQAAGDDADVTALTGFERASRLSYLLWNTMPDEELLLAAEQGTLDDPTGVRAQALRLLEDERSRDALLHFFDRVLDMEKFWAISPADDLAPDLKDDLAELAVEEATRFLENEVILRGGFSTLLSSPATYVNADLAAVYDLPGDFGSEFERVELDPQERAGFFTQIGFLASNATSRDPDPIHRGAFVAKRINCIKIAAPPDMIPPLPEPNGQSNRQLVTEHTEAEGTSCRNCHTGLINPFGFAFEHYDAVGSFRDLDGSHPVDASAEVLVDDEPTFVEDGVELAHQMASSRGVHECLSSYLVEFAQGRTLADGDAGLVRRLGQLSLQAGSLQELIVEIVSSDSFLMLRQSPEEDGTP